MTSHPPARVASFVREQPAVLARQLTVLPDRIGAALHAAGADATREVLLVGSGTSHYASRLAAPTFRRPVRALVPTDALHHPGDLVLGPRTLVVGVSQSGRSTGTLAVLDRARDAGAATLLVTGEPADGPHPALDVACGPEPVGAKTKGFTATVLALHLLAHALDPGAGPTTTPDDLSRAPEAVADVLARAAAPVAEIATGRPPTDVHLVTWGPWRPVADEGALKILETARVAVEVWDVEEFLHGPHRRLGPGSLLVVVGDDGPLAARADALAAFVTDVGGRVLQIRPAGRPVADRRHAHVPTGTLPQAAGAIAAIVPLQLLALALTEARGLTPEDEVFPDFYVRLGSKVPEVTR